jgi:hypothetical protein
MAAQLSIGKRVDLSQVCVGRLTRAVTAAQLMTLRTRHDDLRRFAAKRQLVRLLYAQGWNRQRVIDLFAIIDWMLALASGPTSSSTPPRWRPCSAATEGASRQRLRPHPAAACAA